MKSIKRDRIENLLIDSENGDAEAQNALGATLITGYTVKKDILSGFYWYCQAIKKGFVESKWNAGSMLIDGEGGLEINEEIGMSLIEAAAKANNNSACLFLSQCYLDGKHGKEVNNEKAVYWKNKAWDNEEFIEYDGKPIDLEKKYGIKIEKPRKPKMLKETTKGLGLNT